MDNQPCSLYTNLFNLRIPYSRGSSGEHLANTKVDKTLPIELTTIISSIYLSIFELNSFLSCSTNKSGEK